VLYGFYNKLQNIKSLQASLLTNTFKYQQKHFFVASTLWGFYLDSGEAVLEQTLWPIIAANLGKNSLFDEAINKDSSEFVVFADAFAPELQPAARVDVSVSLAEITKTLNVYGERYWESFGPSAAEPFMQMPLSYDHAYGGKAHLYNKNGKGLPDNDSNEFLRFLANIEHPDSPVLSKRITEDKSAYTPQGFAAINSEWPQRKNLYGTFDDDYLQNHMPGLAPDINWDYFYTAPPDQRFDRYLTGDEAFCITNMHETMAEIRGKLPSVVGRCFIEQEISLNELEQGELAQYSDAQKREDKLVTFKEMPLNLDTVYFFPNDNIGIVVHRGTIEINHPQAKDIKKLLVAHQSLTEPAKPSAFYQEQMQLRCDPEDGFKYMMYSAPLIPEGVRCGFKQLLGDEEYKQAMGDNMSAFAEGKKQQAEQEMDETIEKQMAELRASGMDKQADQLLDKIKNPPQDIELSEDAKKLQALTDKILPGIGAMKEAPKLDDLDLTKLNLKAMDEVQAHMEAMAEKQKKEALLQAEQQLDKLKQQAIQQPEMAEQLDPAIKQLEEMLASIDAIPVLTRPDTIEQDTQLAQAAEQLSEQKKMMAEHNIELNEEQQQQMNELEQLLDNKELSAQMQEANDFINDSYLQGAHFIAESSSPHKGQEPELVAALLAGYHAKQVLTAKDFAFCKLTQQKFKLIDLNHGFFEYSQLSQVQFYQSNLTAINFAHAKLTQVTFDHCKIKGANLGAAQLDNCKFIGLILDEITLAKSTFSHCEFIDCDFGERMDMLLETQFRDCIFTRCKLVKLNFIELELSGCQFNQCDLSESIFIKPLFNDASFTGSDLTKVNFVMAKMNNNNFKQVMMNNTRFVGGCDLKGSRFNYAEITETNLRDCQLQNTDFSHAIMYRCDFGDSVVTNSNFNKAIAKQCQFLDTRLSGSTLKGADLMEASFMQADIRNCNFSDANLYSASFLNATLGGTSFYGAILDNTLLKDWRPS
jgi:uncharacterized protein YjbI with pentapeptide repeats